MSGALEELRERLEGTSELFGHAGLRVKLYTELGGSGHDWCAGSAWYGEQINAFSAKRKGRRIEYVGGMLLARDHTALGTASDLLTEAGTWLPDRWRAAVGAGEGAESYHTWLAFLADRGSPPLVSAEGWSDELGGRHAFVLIHRPLRLSCRLIDRYLLAKGADPWEGAAGATVEAERSAAVMSEREKIEAKKLKAVKLAAEHPEWSASRIAEEVGLHRSTLSRYDLFQKAKAEAERSGYQAKRGYRDASTGNIEAED